MKGRTRLGAALTFWGIPAFECQNLKHMSIVLKISSIASACCAA